jgi:MarR family 2-MHQ and catechol resistance regulon transcriptional repressor
MQRTHKSAFLSLANKLKILNNDLRFNMGIQFLSTGLLMNKYIDMRIHKTGQSRSRFEVLHTLITHGGILKPSDLSRLLSRSRQTITEVVDDLEKDGLVKRQLKSDDRRTKSVQITIKGLDVVRKSMPDNLEIVNSSLPILSEEETQALQPILKKIRKHLLDEIYNINKRR